MREYTLDEIADALGRLDYDDRETWVRMALALKTSFGEDGFDTWDEWSARSSVYDAAAARSVWRTAKPGKLTVGSLIHAARETGWEPGERRQESADERAQRERRRAERAARLAQEAEQLEQYHQVVADHCAELWERLGPTGKSKYLGEKRVGAHGIRFGREPMISVIYKDSPRAELIVEPGAVRAFLKEINAIPYEERTVSFRHISRGCIAVPLRDIDGELWSLQLIWPTGKKSFFLNARKSGCFHWIGDEPRENPVIIGEGYATMASCHEAMRWPAVVAVDAGNLGTVAAAVRERYPDTRIMIAADNDTETSRNPGVVAATEAARAVRGVMVLPWQ